MSGANESRRPRSVAERFTNLTHEIRQIRFDDKSLGPEVTLQDGFRKHLRTMGDEHRQQLESFRGQVTLDTIPDQLPGFEIEIEWAEMDRQNGLLHKT